MTGAALARGVLSTHSSGFTMLYSAAAKKYFFSIIGIIEWVCYAGCCYLYVYLIYYVI